MLVRRAVVAVRQRRALAGLALARRRLAAGDAAVERAGLDLLLDERDRSADALANRPGNAGLRGDREIASNVLEEGAIGACEILRIGGEARHRQLALLQHVAARLEARLVIGVRVDQILDRPVDRP